MHGGEARAARARAITAKDAKLKREGRKEGSSGTHAGGVTASWSSEKRMGEQKRTGSIGRVERNFVRCTTCGASRGDDGDKNEKCRFIEPR